MDLDLMWLLLICVQSNILVSYLDICEVSARYLISIGFADFLHDYDPEHRDGKALIRQMAIFCHIHFTRGVDDALRRAGGGQPGVRQRMLQLLYAEDREGYIAVINFLQGDSISHSYLLDIY
jgi:hypothetical protein